MNIQKLFEVINSFINKQVCQCGHMAIHFPGDECILLHISIMLFCWNFVYLGISIATAELNNGLWCHKKCTALLS